MLVETVFWFHPLVWWIGKRMVAERELACDEEVVRRGNVRVSYAEGILNVCRLYGESPLVCAAGVTGADLKRRIQAIVTGRVPLEMTVARRAALVVACLVALATPLIVGAVHAASVHVSAPVVIAQALPAPPAPVVKPPAAKAPAPPPAVFEAVSIKPLATAEYPGIWAHMSGSRLSIEAMTVGNMIGWAYGVKGYQVTGGPAWTGSGQRYDGAIRYNIEAKADGDGARTRDQFNEMVKAMLADRFRLTIHHEQKMIPVYALVIDKGGPKFKESGPDSAHMLRCCQPLTADGIGMDMLANQFNNTNGSDRPVIDQTGLKGVYTFTLEWDRPELHNGESTGPSIFTAMREQLGLRLEPTTAPVDVLVIDNVEKPSEN
jgi:uncharacterized protein (TIGR03435 family)